MIKDLLATKKDSRSVYGNRGGDSAWFRDSRMGAIAVQQESSLCFCPAAKPRFLTSLECHTADAKISAKPEPKPKPKP
jgi:hypothetical protein